MSLCLEFVRSIDERGEDLNEHMVATKAKGCGVCWHAGGGPSELMGEDGAARRYSGLHRSDDMVDAFAVERSTSPRMYVVH